MTRIPWSELPAYKARHNLVTVDVIWLEGAEAGSVFAPADAPLPAHNPTPPPPPSPAPKPEERKPGLAGVLESMLKRAEREIGEPVRKELAGGMRIDLMVCKDGMTRIQLSREGVYPSVTEWATTLGYFPYPVPDVDQKQFTDHGRYFLRSAWPTPISEMEVING